MRGVSNKHCLLTFFIKNICIADMNMFARFDEIPTMTLQDIEETKRYGWTNERTNGQCENSIPPTNTVCGGINMKK